MAESTKNTQNYCHLVRESLSARFDGESPVIEDSTVREHLAGCTDCSEFESGLIQFKSLWQENNSGESHQAELLWQQCVARIDAESPAGAERNPPVHGESTTTQYLKDTQKPRGWKAFALAASLLLCVISAGSLLLDRSSDATQLVVETVRDFETFQVSGELLDVTSNNTTEVVRWTSSKVDFDLPALVHPPNGFTIAGARLCSFFNRRLAFVHYEKDSAVLSLYVMKADGIKLQGNGVFETGRTESGLTTVAWTRDDLAYVIVSELPESETLQFASRT